MALVRGKIQIRTIYHLLLARDGIAIYCWRDLRTLQKVIAFVVTVFLKD